MIVTGTGVSELVVAASVDVRVLPAPALAGGALAAGDELAVACVDGAAVVAAAVLAAAPIATNRAIAAAVAPPATVV